MSFAIIMHGGLGRAVNFAAMSLYRSTFVRVVDHVTHTKDLFSNDPGLIEANIDTRMNRAVLQSTLRRGY